MDLLEFYDEKFQGLASIEDFRNLIAILENNTKEDVLKALAELEYNGEF
jgi:hypothetical protein